MDTLIDREGTESSAEAEKKTVITVNKFVLSDWFEPVEDKVMAPDEMVKSLDEQNWAKRSSGLFEVKVFDERGVLVLGADRDFEDLVRLADKTGSTMITDLHPEITDDNWEPQVWRRTEGGFVKMKLTGKYSFGTAKEWHEALD